MIEQILRNRLGVGGIKAIIYTIYITYYILYITYICIIYICILTYVCLERLEKVIWWNQYFLTSFYLFFQYTFIFVLGVHYNIYKVVIISHS
jgi:hypothetical protein